MLSQYLQSRRTIFLIGIILGLFIVSLALFLQEPYIRDLNPRQALPGDTITISGQYFGQFGPRKSLVVGSQRITSSHILSWQEQEIRFRMPEGMRSGYISVKNNQSTSNFVFLTNIERIPQPLSSESNLNIEAALIANTLNSLWRISANVDLNVFDIIVQGRKIKDEHRIPLADGGLGIYIPEILMTEGRSRIVNNNSLSANLLLSQLELSKKQILDQNDFFRIKPRSRIQIFSNAFGSELYSIIIDFMAEDPSEWEELILFIPLPQIPSRTVSMESTFRGWVQLLPFSDTHARLRLLPYNQVSGTVRVQFFGNALNYSHANSSSELQELEISRNAMLLPLYEEFLIPTEISLLSPAESQELESTITSESSSLLLVSEVYTWFSENNLLNNSEALANELRQRDIPARVRTGYTITEGNSNTRTWVEIFIPQLGWIPASSETMYADIIPLPLENPFPSIFDNRGNILEGIMNYSVEFAEFSESLSRF